MNILINSGRAKPYLTTRRLLISFLISKGHKVILTGYQEGYEEEIKNIGASFIKVPFERAGFSPIQDLKLIKKYYQIIKDEEIDIIHSYTIKPNIYGSIAAGFSGIKNVYPTLNGIGYAFTGKGMNASIIRLFASLLYWCAFKFSKRVFFHNNDDIELFLKYRLLPKYKCVLIPGSGIDTNYYSQKDMPDEISFLLISRLLKAKGIFEYIKSAEIVKKKYPRIKFKLIGPTDPNPSGIKLEEIKNYINKGIITYFFEQHDIRPFLEECAVYVLPSYREGLPHSVLEAMSTGRAIITTAVAGCRETVLENSNGFLVMPFEINDLAEKMIWMIENPERVKKMGVKSRHIAETKFDVKNVNNIIIKTMNLF